MTTTQRSRAIDMAHETRTGIAEFRRDAHALGPVESARHVARVIRLDYEDRILGAARVGHLLKCIPRLGEGKVERCLALAGVENVKVRLRDLTPKQREAIVTQLELLRLDVVAVNDRKPGDSPSGFQREVYPDRRRYSMTLTDAQALVARKYIELQDRQLKCALPPLTDLTDGERRLEMLARLNLVAADGPTVDVLAAIGAHVVAWIRSVDEREMHDVTSGDAA